MSYSISWSVEAKLSKPSKEPFFMSIGLYPNRQDNITYNVGAIMKKATGLSWENGDMGLVKDVIPKLEQGIKEIEAHWNDYKALEPDNGWGSVEGVIDFFSNLILDYRSLKNDSFYNLIADDIHFIIS